MRQQYDSYKPTGIDWIGDIPSHWEVMPIKHLASYNDEVLSENTNPNQVIRYVEIGDVNHTSGITTNKEYTFKEAPSRARRITRHGDIIVSTVRTYLKAIAKVKECGLIVSTGFMVLRARKSIIANYLAYAIINDSFIQEIISKSVGVSYPAINSSEVANIKILVPPLAEQEAIATWLDEKCEEIDAAIAKVDREIELIDELKQSEISRVVTRGLNPDAPLRPSGVDWIGDIPEHWKLVPLKHLVSYNDDVLSENIDKNHLINYVEIGDVCQSNGITNYKEYTFKEAPSRARRITKKGDVIISTVRTYLKAIAKVKQDDLIVSTGFMVLRARSIDCNFLSFSLLNETFIQKIISKSTGVSYPAINSSDIANIRILVPPMSEQQAIADNLDRKCAEIDGLKAKLTKKRETLTELRQSIISEVVTGKRKVI